MNPVPVEHVAGRSSAAALIERLWRGDAGPWAWLDAALIPFEFAFRAVTRVHHGAYTAGWRRSHRLPVPVVSIGNLAVGGTGKTPVTRWVVEELKRRGAKPAVLHGGYAMDEPALHRAWHPDVPVVVERDRVAGGVRAIEAGAGVLVLDDGFQHRRLARDLDIVLVAAETWTLRPRLLPRGPWREGPEALARAHVVAVTRRTASRGEAEAVAAQVCDHGPDGATVVQIHLAPAGWRSAGDGRPADPPGGDVVAVAGVARPEAFLAHAAAAGARVADVLIFRDHQDYDEDDVRRIGDVAAGRVVVTTAKDAVKLAARAPHLDILVLEQQVAVEAGADALARRLDELLKWRTSRATCS